MASPRRAPPKSGLSLDLFCKILNFFFSRILQYLKNNYVVFVPNQVLEKLLRNIKQSSVPKKERTIMQFLIPSNIRIFRRSWLFCLIEAKEKEKVLQGKEVHRGKGAAPLAKVVVRRRGGAWRHGRVYFHNNDKINFKLIFSTNQRLFFVYLFADCSSIFSTIFVDFDSFFNVFLWICLSNAHRCFLSLFFQHYIYWGFAIKFHVISFCCSILLSIDY